MTSDTPRTGGGAIEDRRQPEVRVCHVVTSLRMGGLERMVCTLVDGLATLGISSFVFCTDEQGELFDGLPNESKAVYHRNPGRLGIDWRLVLRLRRFARQQRVSVIHAHNPSPHLYGTLVSLLTGIPVVTTTHGQGYGERRRVRWLRRLLSIPSSAVVFVSDDARQMALRDGAASFRKSIVLPNGIDTRLFVPEGAAAVRTKLGITNEALVIGSVGRLAPEKNYPLLVRAFARLLSDRETVEGNTPHLLLVGDGPERSRLEGLVNEFGLVERCTLAGMQSDVRPWLQTMDVFCLPSDTEGLAMTLLEACACGRPAVVTHVGGNAEIVVDGVSGFVTPKGDEHALGSALTKLAASSDLRRSMGQAARRIAEERYSLHAMADGYARLYARVLRRER